VSDTGIGIPSSFLPYVFDRFSQRDGTASRGYGGLGLGLAITKQLVELHGGVVLAKSPGEGQGATFTVTLPLLVVQDEGKRENRVHPTHASSGEQMRLPKLDGLRVLVVDDEADARDLIARILADQGAIVATASTGEDALASVATSAPDVLVCDIGMPGMDGYQLMRSIRGSEPPGRRLPALALTAFARAEDRKRAMLAGYQTHVAKPFDLAELVLVVAGMVDRI
jgi:CheY-like chemotaxis protein